MKKSSFKKSIACLLLILVIAAGFAIPSSAYSSQNSKLFSLFASEGGSLQGYIDNVLAPDAGTGDSEWLFIALKRHDPSLNCDKFVAALDSFVSSNDLTKETDFERISMAYTAAGVNNDFVKSALELDLSNSTLNGIFFELILINSGDYKSAKNSKDNLINKILAAQKSDGGWTIFGPSDVDMTAMALQALAPYKSRNNVTSAIESALAFLSKKQNPEGDFLGFKNTVSSESTSQVIIALTALGIDPAKDERFIKTDTQDDTLRHTAYDGLNRYQLDDGSYCHTIGNGKNYKATAQAACALAAAERFNAGKSALYSFVKPAEPSADIPAVVTPDEPDESASSPAPEDKTSSSSDEDASSPSSSNDVSNSSDESSEAAESFSSQEAASEQTPDMQNGDAAVSSSTNNNTYKYYVCGGIVLMFAFACVYLRVRQQATLKNIIPIAIGAIMLICGVLFFNFTSVKDYYNVNLDSATDGDSAVTISINCKILDGVADDIPEDGYILKPTKYVIKEGDTVFDALLAVTRANKIKISYTGSGGLISVYVSSIGGYTEMQYGALSGWIYRVNKVTPDVGCGSFDLKDGDVIEWVYTLDLGKDVDRYD